MAEEKKIITEDEIDLLEIAPGPMCYDAADTFREYISQAGGFSDNARLGKAYMVYANWPSAPRRFLFLRITRK